MVAVWFGLAAWALGQDADADQAKALLARGLKQYKALDFVQAKATLLKVKRDKLTDADRKVLDSYLKRVDEAIKKQAAAQEAYDAAVKALAANKLQEAAKLFEQAAASEFLKDAVRAEARKQAALARKRIEVARVAAAARKPKPAAGSRARRAWASGNGASSQIKANPTTHAAAAANILRCFGFTVFSPPVPFPAQNLLRAARPPRPPPRRAPTARQTPRLRSRSAAAIPTPASRKPRKAATRASAPAKALARPRRKLKPRRPRREDPPIFPPRPRPKPPPTGQDANRGRRSEPGGARPAQAREPAPPNRTDRAANVPTPQPKARRSPRTPPRSATPTTASPKRIS